MYIKSPSRLHVGLIDMNGSYNGMKRIIEFKNYDLEDLDPNVEKLGGTTLNNADGFELIEIRGIHKGYSFSFSNVNGETFTKKDYAYKGDYGVYTEEKTS